MNEGFILLSRAILDSDVFASQKLLKIWIWCLCKANFKDRTAPLKIGKGETIIKVKRGSFIFGRFKAEEELFIDGSTVYKSIKKLQDMDMIKIESNNQYSIITICKYDEYQQSDNYKVTSKEQPSNSEVTAEGQPSNTTKNVNKDNNLNNVIKKDINERKTEFLNSLHPLFLNKNDLNDFYLYWTEHGEKDKKMRFEKERSFGVERRVTTWMKNKEKFNKNGKEKLTGAQAFIRQFENL